MLADTLFDGLSQLGNLVWAVLRIERKLDELQGKVDAIMTQQDDLNADVQALTTALADVTTQTGNVVNLTTQIQAEIAALQAGNPALDLTALDSLAGQASQVSAALDSAVTSLGGLVPPAQPPAAPAE